MELLEKLPEQILDANWIEEYESALNIIWKQLIRLNSTLFVLRHILQFPFALFGVTPPYSLFWSLCSLSLLESAILGIWRISVDSSNPDGITIRTLKNMIRDNIRRASDLDNFDELLKYTQFEAESKLIESKVIELRHNYYAHLNRNKIDNSTPDEIEKRRITLEELENYRKRLNRFFKVLCFGHGRGVWPLAYEPSVQHPIGSDPRTDIEKILDDIAASSQIMKSSDQKDLNWDILRETLKPEDIEVLNRYRRKLGRPEVD